MNNNLLNIEQILKILPHRYPFLLIDKVINIDFNNSIEAQKNITINEPFFVGHFPDKPIMPGVIALEVMAQASAILAFESRKTRKSEDEIVYFLGIDNARFRKPIIPGDILQIISKVNRVIKGIWKFNCQIFVSGNIAVEANLMCTMSKKNDS